MPRRSDGGSGSSQADTSPESSQPFPPLETDETETPLLETTPTSANVNGRQQETSDEQEVDFDREHNASPPSFATRPDPIVTPRLSGTETGSEEPDSSPERGLSPGIEIEIEDEDEAEFQSQYSLENGSSGGLEGESFDSDDISDEDEEEDEDEDAVNDASEANTNNVIMSRPFMQSTSSLHGPNAFAPPFYNRPPTPLPPSPSLTSLLRPPFSTTTSRPTTPDTSDAETPNDTEAAVAKSARIATTVPRASPKVPTYEYYGFVLYLASSFAFLIYLLWSYLPSPFLHQLGIYYYPNRWWSLAIPSYIVMTIVYIYVALASYNTGYLTLPLTSIESIVDEAANIAVIDGKGRRRPGGSERIKPGAATSQKMAAVQNRHTGPHDHHHHHHNHHRPHNHGASSAPPNWREVWAEGADAVMDIPVGGVCEVLYGREREEDPELILLEEIEMEMARERERELEQSSSKGDDARHHLYDSRRWYGRYYQRQRGLFDYPQGLSVSESLMKYRNNGYATTASSPSAEYRDNPAGPVGRRW